MTDDTDDADDLHPVDADALRRAGNRAARTGSARTIGRHVGRQALSASPALVRGRDVRRILRAGPQALRLKLWQSPPCHLSEDGNARDCDIEGQVLLRKMIGAGLSPLEPDPVGALAAKAKRDAEPKRAEKRPAKSAAHDEKLNVE